MILIDYEMKKMDEFEYHAPNTFWLHSKFKPKLQFFYTYACFDESGTNFCRSFMDPTDVLLNLPLTNGRKEQLLKIK